MKDVRCPKCQELVVEMVDERNNDQYYVCHDCKSAYRKCEIYSRVVGYLRPTCQWNEGKQQEFKERKTYKIK